MSERRRLPRWQIRQPVKITLPGAQVPAACQIMDINLKGMQVLLGLKLATDTFVKIKIILAEGFILDIIEAWIVWRRALDGKNIYGLYFTQIKDNDKENIYKFMRKYFPNQINKQWWQSQVKKEGGELMQEENLQDRRIFARFPARLPLRFLDLQGNTEGEAFTEDISAKGVGFMAKEAFQPHTPLEVWFKIPDQGEPLYARGEVVWSKMVEPEQHRIGVNLEKADLMGLSRVLRVT